MEKFTNTIIGTIGYPVDNSYSFTIGTNRNPMLAGTSGTNARRVTIVSEPYVLNYNPMGYESTHEFVTVEYGGYLHVVLNNFKEYKPLKLQLNDEYEAEVIGDKIKVGCAEFPIKKVRELIEKIDQIK